MLARRVAKWALAARHTRLQSSATSQSHFQRKDRPRRALFNVPSSDERKIAKAATIRADSIVFDLEDGVAANKKVEARALAFRALEDLELSPVSERAVRINSVESGLALEDLAAVLQSRRLETIVVPKVHSPADLQIIERVVEAAEANGAPRRPVGLIACIESAEGLLNAPAIAATAPERLQALVFSSEDFCADTGILRSEQLHELIYARSAVVAAAASRQLQAIDLVCIDFRNEAQLDFECALGRQFGFTGKQAIHPGQVDAIQRAFAPLAADLERARRIVAGYHEHLARGVGAFVVDGKMIDMPVVKWALRLVATAEHISASESL